jgi:site-specific DNA-methyltransferase (adenine-specific)
VVIPFEPLWREYKRLIKPRGAIVLFGSQPFTSLLVTSNLAWFKYQWVWEKSIAGDCMNAKNKPMPKHEDMCVFSPGTTANRSLLRMAYYPQDLQPCNRKRTGRDYGATGGSFKVPRPSHGPYTQRAEGYPTSIVYFAKDTETLHPTQKPVALLEYLIRTYTNEGGTVLDNTMGSGTTGVACVQTGRSFVGIEKDAGYFDIAKRRIETAQLPLLEAA